MIKVKTVMFRQLPFPAHYDFFERLSVSIAQGSSVIRTALALLIPGFNSWLVKEGDVLNWVRKSELTKQIAEVDQRIDHILGSINNSVQASLNSPDNVTKETAVRVQIMLKNYGNVARKPYTAKAGDIRAILAQFAGEYETDETTLGLSVWISALTNEFDTFNNLLAQRKEQQIEKPDLNSVQVRKGIEDVYRQMVIVLDSNSALGTSPDFDAFIERINFDIDFFNTEYHHAKKDLSELGHTVIEPINTQVYTGEPISVIPKVHYLEDGKPTEKLVFAKDFSVTYKNNINIGMAELTVHGKGKYKGMKSIAFNIAHI
jgi:hypothetical protein